MKKILDTEYDSILYRVQPGDRLADILQSYHGRLRNNDIQILISATLEKNPELTNPNLIYPDQLIELDVPRQQCSAPVNNHKLQSNSADPIPIFKKEWKSSDKNQRDMLNSLAPYLVAGSIGVSSASLTGLNQLLSTNSSSLTDLARNYEQYKSGALSKSQYDYRRRQIIHQLRIRLGKPTEKILFQGRRANEVLRIQRSNISAPTQVITHHSVKMDSIAKWASRGGVVLTGVNLALACHQISNTSDVNNKNEIFVETLGSVGAGLLYGASIAIGLAVMATPIGWGAAILIGSGSVLAGIAGGKATAAAYDRFGNKIDLLSMSGAGRVCR